MISLEPRSFRVVFLLECPRYVFLRDSGGICVPFLAFPVPRVIAGLFSRFQPVLLLLWAGINEIEGDRLKRSPNSSPNVTCTRRLSSKMRGKTAGIVLTRSAPLRFARVAFFVLHFSVWVNMG